MAKNITIAGADYPSVPSIIAPITGGGTATFVETSDADATAADIASGKTAYVNGSLITGTASGGALKMGVIRPDAELVQSFTYDKYIVADEGKTLPSYTTTATTLLASSDLSPTITMARDSYHYFILFRALAIPSYVSGTGYGKGRQEYSFNQGLYEYIYFPANTFGAISTTQKYTSALAQVLNEGSQTYSFCWTSATGTTVVASSYGCAAAATVPTASGTTLTIKSPALKVQGNTNYFASTYMNALSDIRYQYVIEVYRAPVSGSLAGMWGATSQCSHDNTCINSPTHKLT